MSNNYVQKMTFFLSRNKLETILQEAEGTLWSGLELNLAIADTGKIFIDVTTYIGPNIPGSPNDDDNAAIPTPPGGHTNY